MSLRVVSQMDQARHHALAPGKVSRQIAFSLIFLVCLAEPFQDFVIQVLQLSKADLNRHRLVNATRFEPAARSKALEPEAEIDPVLGCGPYPRERPLLGHERDVPLAGLYHDLAQG